MYQVVTFDGHKWIRLQMVLIRWLRYRVRSNSICSSIRENIVLLCAKGNHFFFIIIHFIQRPNIHFRRSFGFVHFCKSMPSGNVHAHTPIHHTIWYWLMWKKFCVWFAFGFGIWIYWNRSRSRHISEPTYTCNRNRKAFGTKMKGFVWLRGMKKKCLSQVLKTFSRIPDDAVLEY